MKVMRQETRWTIVGIDKGSTIARELGEGRVDRVVEEMGMTIDTVINTAAMTNVDSCETRRSEAWETNVRLVERLVVLCRETGAGLIHVSSDNVFDGEKGPYDELDTPAPVNYYGRTKLASEQVCRGAEIGCLVIRTMWLYGAEGGKPSFESWVAGELEQERGVRIACDEVGTPTHVDDVAYAMVTGIERGITGLLHVGGARRMTRCEMAYVIAEKRGCDSGLITRVKSAELGRAARRPLNSGLVSTRLISELGMRCREWSVE